ncbi:FxsA family protein [Kiloniella sp. b19]|uniref:FxsA family protein n=1 Tax=Kiloniella sp. GXU_MW_B19 TaxID=3141326 RepID=UPI0031D1E842
MGLILLLLFIGVPLIEIMIFIEVGEIIGGWNTLAFVILTAVIGTIMIRSQGLMTLARIQTELDAGQLPAREIFNGLCILVAGVLMLTPGFMTDTIGFLLLLPPFRSLIQGGLLNVMKKHGHVRFSTSGPGMRGFGSGQNAGDRGDEFHQGRAGDSENPWKQKQSSGDVIDGEFEDLTDRHDQRKID